ncbi:MAG: diguanylate cyclase, partial [Candidatus Omnitrophica bacterium]|nr:diguanylate cyclase [Candidatus Omnitrophota bacterium]
DRLERTVQPDGSKHIVSTTKIPRKDNKGNVIGIMGITRDITERTRIEEERLRAQKKAEQQARRLKDKLQFEKKKLEQVLTIIEGINTIVNLNKLVDFIVDKTSRILEAKKCTLMLMNEDNNELSIKGYKGVELDEEVNWNGKNNIRDSIVDMVAHEGKSVLVKDVKTDRRFLKKNIIADETKSIIAVPMKSGEQLIGVLIVADKKVAGRSAFTELDLKVLDMIGRQSAIAVENARLYKELNDLSITDPLTKMYNYRHFLRALDMEVKRMKRYYSDLCLLMIDVDEFKAYNDDFGHVEGDKLLKKLSQALTANLRDVDIPCRYAGDEFVVILPKTKLNDAKVVATKIKTKIEEMRLKRKITVSIGAAKLSKNMNRKDLLLKADKLLYKAKKEGKNTVCA